MPHPHPQPRPPRRAALMAAGQALAALLGWLTHAGQAYADTLGYVPCPPPSSNSPPPPCSN